MNARVKGNTGLYAVIGNPISHSISPEIHNSIFDRLQLNKIYIPLEVTSNNLEKTIGTLGGSFLGFNVTIPHKQEIIQYLDELDGQASIYGAVNTVKVVDGRLIGYNTDGHGFSKSLKIKDIDVKDKKILMLGTGGVARVVAHELISTGAELTIASRQVEKANILKEQLASHFGDIEIKTGELNSIRDQYYGIVNCTPVGMSPHGEESPIEEELIKGAFFVFDMIYNPYKTKLLRMAERNKCIAINGFDMLFYQAVKAQEIWFGEGLSEDVMLSAFRELEEYLKNKQGEGK